MTQLEKEYKALRLLNINFDELSQIDKLALHHSLMWTIEALTEVKLLQYYKEV